MRSAYSALSMARGIPKPHLRRSFTTKTHHNRRSFFEWYTNCLERHPIFTKSLTSAIIAGAGDCLCQFNENTKWDVHRTARFSILGFVMVGPGCHYWYGYLAQWFPGTSISQVSLRVVVDQLAFNPPFLFVWLTAFWHMEGISFRSVTEYTDKMKETFPSIIVANWALWFPVQAFTFRWIPIQFQVLATNCFDLLWNAYLSFSTSRKDTTIETETDGDTAANEASTLSVKNLRSETLIR